MQLSRWIAPICLSLLWPLHPAHAFDLTAYQRFLEDHANTSASVMLADHRPATPYVANLDVPLSAVSFLPEIIAQYQLTEDELDLLRLHGFVVSERLARGSYGEALREIWHADLPVYVSADVILHTVHRSFLEVLGAIERGYVAPQLRDVLTMLRDSLPELARHHADHPAMAVSLDDLDVHLTVAQSLIEGTTVPPQFAANAALVGALLDAIEAEAVANFALYNEEFRTIDFSQFRVRGYYTQSELLSRYFRCMMWLGRIDFRLSRPTGVAGPQSVQREVVDAFLLRELVHASGAAPALEQIDRVLRLFVGDPDNSTLGDLDAMAAQLDLSSASDLWDSESYAAFESLLESGVYQPQAINSRILIRDPMSSEPVRPPYAFLLLGQRFTVDSHVLGNVVFDQISYEGNNPFRGLPDPLDVLYVLGNDDVLPLLRSELEAYHYSSNLLALRYLVDAYPQGFWEQSLYNRWLHAIRALAKTGDQTGAPEFMRTGAWQQQKMNSQLASWAELRHDTLLHVKQSYTSGVICSYPFGFVEPVPELFARLRGFADFAHEEITSLGLPAALASRIRGFYGGMSDVMLTLETIAQKELERIPLSDSENEFLQTVLYLDTFQCGEPETGWLRRLYFDTEDWPASTPDWLVADVHTQPTDEFGYYVGHVLHVGTTDPRLAIIATGCEGGPLRAYIGPVASYHQHVTSQFMRLTDEEWESWFGGTRPRPPVPDWTWTYATDADGRIRVGGRVLDQGWSVAVQAPPPLAPDQPVLPSRVAWIRSAPNPFNPRTVIGFEVQGSTAIDVHVRIFDVRGSLVRELLHEPLRPDTWFVAWDGTDDRGQASASGVYYARIDAAERSLSTKLTLVR